MKRLVPDHVAADVSPPSASAATKENGRQMMEDGQSHATDGSGCAQIQAGLDANFTNERELNSRVLAQFASNEAWFRLAPLNFQTIRPPSSVVRPPVSAFSVSVFQRVSLSGFSVSAFQVLDCSSLFAN